MSQQSATVAYEKALAFLNKMSTERAITEQLSPQSAATGDQFEIVKFLVALINEMRISNQELLNFHYGLDPIVFAHLSDIFRHIDDQANWDPVDLWPSVLFQGLSVDCSNESQSQSTPKLSTARTRAPRFSASQRKPSLAVRHSPLADVLSSPRVREARLLREKEREIKKYRERADLLECEKEDLEARIDKLNVELNKFCKRADQKAALAERWENELNSVKAEVDELREKLNRKQAAFHEAEKTIKDLMQSKLICEVGQSFAVTGQDAEIRRLEYDNSEKAGQLDVASDHNISLTKTVADLRIQSESILQKLREKSDLVEDSKRAAIAAANEREELQMILDSLRERIREEVSQIFSQLRFLLNNISEQRWVKIRLAYS
ncbi:unnamed protein product [Toxocara canis]|uniref:Uncharacterized protein n=1 Tax=Toxocara canis TaxID=6265 RepID=A0A183U033_TOXCA|nr:unnamed protein product [Toxocara canis]